MVLRALFAEIQKQVKPELDAMHARTEVKITINALDIGIQSLLDNMNADMRPDIKGKLLGYLAEENIFPNIPNDVTSITLSDGTRLSRRDSEVNAIEEKKRRNWSLREVDEMVANYANSINQPRVPLVQK